MEFFAAANTRYGFKSLFEEIFAKTERLYILKGSSGCGKSTLMRKIAADAKARGIDYDIIRCSADPESLDGVIFPALKTAIADGTAPHVLDVKYPCARESIINLGQFWQEEHILPHRARIIGLTDLKACHYKNASRALSAMGNTGDLLREILTPFIDRKRLDAFAFKLGERAFGESGGRKSLFSTAITAEGTKTLPVFEDVENLITISGKASSELINAIEQIASERAVGYIASLCFLDPQRVDSLFFPTTSTLITVLQSPPCKSAKSEQAVSTTKFIDQRVSLVKNRISGLERLSAQIAAEAQRELLDAKSVHNELESIYIPAMNFNLLDEFTKTLSKKIVGE